MKGLRTERLLARTYFGQFFESDLMPSGLPQVQIAIWGIALLAAPGYLLSFVSAIKYGGAPRRTLPAAMLVDQLTFVTFAMTALGLVALITWESVFPDRRDARILGVLPLATRSHVVGRITALGAIAALFCVGVNLPSAVVYGLAVWWYEAASGPLHGVAAHLISTAMGGLFTFFVVIAAQGVLLNVFGRRTAARLALLVQTLFVVVLLQMLLFVPYLGSRLRTAFNGDEPSIVALLPPGWFLALYHVIAGRPRPISAAYAFTAVAATAAVVIAATALLAFSYKRLVRMALETLDSSPRSMSKKGRSFTFQRAGTARIAGLLARHPVQRAVAAFALRTIGRSRTHLTLLATYVGVAAALVLSSLVPLLAGRSRMAPGTPGVTLLSAPLVVNFLAVCGVRVLFDIPTEIKANWAFRLYAPEDRMLAAIDGARTALLVSVVAPIALAAGIIGVALWDTRTGVLHALFTGAVGTLLADVLLIGFRKIPFVCTYAPGRSRARTLWPMYVIAFSIYAYGLAELEAATLNRPLLFSVVLAAIAVLVACLARLRRWDLVPPPGLTYEEKPEGPFGGFSLSEGLAAESPAAPVSRHGRQLNRVART